MKVSKIKNRVNEGFFSDLVQGKAKLGAFIGKNAELRNDPRIIQEVARKGFLDFRDRLTKAGINLKNAAAISTPETQDTIKVNLIKYIEEYITGGETQENKVNLTVKLQKIPLPAKFDEKTIFEYFYAAAELRAQTIIDAEQNLPVNDIIKKIKLLQSQIPNDNEIVFPFNGAEVIIRKEKESGTGIYITDWTKLGTALPAPKQQILYPHDNPVYEFFDVQNDEAAHNAHIQNIEKIYGAYLNMSPRPAPTPFNQKIQELQQLQQSLEDNQEISFDYNFDGSTTGGVATIGTNIVIRNSAVYVSDYVSSSTSTKEPKKVDLGPPHNEMFSVQRPTNLANIYNAYISAGKPAPTEYISKDLE
jgi:hypothetical protein